MSFGTLGHVLLGLLVGCERTGYELAHDFDASLANVWAAKHSQIYPELARLEALGLIRKTSTGPRGSQRYAITADGLAEVERWLTETEPADAPRSESMVRVFFLGMIAPEQAIAFLAGDRARHQLRLKRYQSIADRVPLNEPETRWSRIALEAGMRRETVMVDWASWAIGLVEAEMDGTESPAGLESSKRS